MLCHFGVSPSFIPTSLRFTLRVPPWGDGRSPPHSDSLLPPRRLPLGVCSLSVTVTTLRPPGLARWYLSGRPTGAFPGR